MCSATSRTCCTYSTCRGSDACPAAARRALISSAGPARGRPCGTLSRSRSLTAAAAALAVRRKKNLDKQSSDIQSQFDATAWGKKLTSKKLRSNLSDFGRFKVSIAKQKRNKLIATKLAAKVA